MGPGECMEDACPEEAEYRCTIESMNARGYRVAVIACKTHIEGAAYVAAERLKAIEEEDPISEDAPPDPFVQATEEIRQEEEARAAAQALQHALHARAAEAARLAGGAAPRAFPGGLLLVGGGEESRRARGDHDPPSPLVAGTVGMILGLLIGGRR